MKTMKLKRIYLIHIIICGLYLLALYGCGGGETGSEEKEINQGLFLDSPVEGLEYISDNNFGITDANGTFKYADGSTVKFFIGDILVGEAIGKPIITPADLVPGSQNELDPTVTNIARFLLSIDDDANPENGIFINEKVKNDAVGRSVNFAQGLDEFEADSNVQTVIADLTSATLAGSRPLISKLETQDHLRRTLLEINGESVGEICSKPPCIMIKEIWSDQFEGIRANYLSWEAGVPSNKKNYILMGASSDLKPHVKAELSIIPTDMAVIQSVLVRLAIISHDKIIPVGVGSFD